MTSSETIAVVGGGLAAAHAVETLRSAGYDGHLVLFGAEPHRPYERPPLSKGFLTGQDALDTVFAHPADWYETHDVQLRLEQRVTALDLDARAVVAGPDRQRFDRLLLATGATPRRLETADRSGAPVLYLRTIEDSKRLREALRPGIRIVVVGGGWIGLEVAAAARGADAEVTVVERLELPLLRVLGPEVSRIFADLHRAHGVDLRVSTGVVRIREQAGRAAVLLEDGSELLADLLVAGVGVTPEVDVARSAGLEVDNGIVTDEFLHTSHAGIYAAGDVANAFHPVLGRHLRVEHWDNAIEQGRTAGRNLLGEAVPYERLPYFFTDQYDLGMEYVGTVGPDGYDEVILRGDPTDGAFAAFWLRQGRVLAGMHVNDWDAIEPIRGIVGAQSADPAALGDPDIPLHTQP